jgi:hypothetical protein
MVEKAAKDPRAGKGAIEGVADPKSGRTTPTLSASSSRC